MRFTLKNIKSPKGVVFIAEKDGNAIGYAMGLIEKNIPLYKVENLGHFIDLLVIKKFRGKGVATQLKNEMFKWFRSKKVTVAKISSHAENKRSRTIYRNWKFRDFHVQMRRKL